MTAAIIRHTEVTSCPLGLGPPSSGRLRALPLPSPLAFAPWALLQALPWPSCPSWAPFHKASPKAAKGEKCVMKLLFCVVDNFGFNFNERLRAAANHKSSFASVSCTTCVVHCRVIHANLLLTIHLIFLCDGRKSKT